MSKFDVKAEDGALCLGIDLNEDGEKLMMAKLNVSEAIQEALQRGESIEVEGAKVVGFKFELTKLKLMIDTDKDGEKLLELEIDLAEALDESGLMDKMS